MKDNFFRLICCLFLVFSSIGFVSCDWEDVDDDIHVDNVTYIGLWDLRREIVDDGVRETMYDSDRDTDMFIEFQDNGDFFIYRSYSVRDDYYYLVSSGLPDDQGYWAVSGHRLILKYDSRYEEEWNMEELSSTTLQLEYIPYEGERVAKTRRFARVHYDEVDFYGEE